MACRALPRSSKFPSLPHDDDSPGHCIRSRPSSQILSEPCPRSMERGETDSLLPGQNRSTWLLQIIKEKLLGSLSKELFILSSMALPYGSHILE